MPIYQPGDKVRHKTHGHVLDVISVEGDTLEVGFTFADIYVCDWPIDECEPHEHQNTLINHTSPE